MSDVIAEIEALEPFNTLECGDCKRQIRVHALQIYANCPQCSSEIKCRSFGAIGTEIQDVIDAVLAWARTDEELDALLARRQEILSD